MNTIGSDTLVGRLIRFKESWDVSGIYLFTFILFYFVCCFVRVSLERKDVENWGSMSVYQAVSFWTVYFSPGTRAGSDHD